MLAMSIMRVERGGLLKQSVIDMTKSNNVRKFQKFTRFDVHVDELNNYYNQLKIARSTRKNFVDEEFSYKNHESLGGGDGHYFEYIKDNRKAKDYVWRRPNEWLGNK